MCFSSCFIQTAVKCKQIAVLKTSWYWSFMIECRGRLGSQNTGQLSSACARPTNENTWDITHSLPHSSPITWIDYQVLLDAWQCSAVLIFEFQWRRVGTPYPTWFAVPYFSLSANIAPFSKNKKNMNFLSLYVCGRIVCTEYSISTTGTFTEVAKMLLPPLYTVQETSVELSPKLVSGKSKTGH